MFNSVTFHFSLRRWTCNVGVCFDLCVHTTLQAIVDSRIGFVITWLTLGLSLTTGAVAAGDFVCFAPEKVMEAKW